MNEQPELIKVEEPLKWLARTSVITKFDKKKEMSADSVTVELVWGRREDQKGRNDVTINRVVGETYHSLRGPTAEASIEQMAKDLNSKGFVPKGKTIRTRADGWKQGKDAPNTLHQEFVLPEEYQ